MQWSQIDRLMTNLQIEQLCFTVQAEPCSHLFWSSGKRNKAVRRRARQIHVWVWRSLIHLELIEFPFLCYRSTMIFRSVLVLGVSCFEFLGYCHGLEFFIEFWERMVLTEIKLIWKKQSITNYILVFDNLSRSKSCSECAWLGWMSSYLMDF